MLEFILLCDCSRLVYEHLTMSLCFFLIKSHPKQNKLPFFLHRDTKSLVRRRHEVSTGDIQIRVLCLQALFTRFEAESSATGRNRLMLTVAVSGYKTQIETSYQVNLIHK